MRFFGFAIVAFSLACLSAPRFSRGGAAEDELAKMKGTWNVVEENIRDYDNTKDPARPPTATIEGDKITFKDKKGKAEDDGVMKISDIDASDSPAKLTLHVPSRHGGKDQTASLPGIYKVDGDKLEIAIAEEPGQPRPEKLGPGKHVVYWRCERQK